MAWTKIRLVHIETGKALDAGWTPCVQDEELHSANQQLGLRNMPWRWLPLNPSQPARPGNQHDPTQVRPAGSGS